jgi:hypothetical protein
MATRTTKNYQFIYQYVYQKKMSEVRKHRDNGHEGRNDGKAVEIHTLHNAIYHIAIYPRTQGAVRMPKVRNHMEANLT